MRKRAISYVLAGLVVLALLFGMTGSANAGTVYILTTNIPSPSNPSQTFGGHVEIDPADISPGARLQESDFIDWEFNFDGETWSKTGGDIFIGGNDDVFLGTQRGAAGTDTNMIGFWTITVGRPGTTFRFGQTGKPLFRYNQLFNGNSQIIYVSDSGAQDGDYRNLSNVPGTWVAASSSVPEPGTLSLLASGLLVGCLARFRRRFQ